MRFAPEEKTFVGRVYRIASSRLVSGDPELFNENKNRSEQLIRRTSSSTSKSFVASSTLPKEAEERGVRLKVSFSRETTSPRTVHSLFLVSSGFPPPPAHPPLRP